MTLEDQIARIIDPDAFRLEHEGAARHVQSYAIECQAVALRKARAILALEPLRAVVLMDVRGRID